MPSSGVKGTWEKKKKKSKKIEKFAYVQPLEIILKRGPI